MMQSTPYTGQVLDNPLFSRDLRIVRRGLLHNRISRSSLRIIVLTQVVLYVLFAGILLLAYVNAPPGAEVWAVSQANGGLIIGSLLVGVGANLLLDFAAMIVSVGGISAEINFGRWDLLRLTLLPEADIAAAKHTLAQLRIWRMTAILVSARAAAIVFLLFSTLIMPMLLYNSSSSLSNEDGLVMWLTFSMIGMASFVYVAEPLWRMKAMTALGTLISTYTRSFTSSLLVGLGAIVGVVIVQALILAGFYYVLIQLALRISQYLYDNYSYGYPHQIYAPLLLFVICVLLSGVIYVFYLQLQRWALSHTQRRIQLQD